MRLAPSDLGTNRPPRWWRVVGALQWVLLAAAVGGKLLGVRLAGRILKWGKGEASLVGWLLQTKALIMIIFSNVLLDKKVVTSETFTALLIMAVLSTMLTIPMVLPKLKRASELVNLDLGMVGTPNVLPGE